MLYFTYHDATHPILTSTSTRFHGLISKQINMKNTSVAYSFNNTFLSSTKAFPSKAEGIAWCIAFALEAVLIVLGNLLTIILFAVNKNLRKKSLLLVINMAFANLLFGSVFLPLHIYVLGGYHQLWTAMLTTRLNMFSNITKTLFAQVTVISAGLMSCERFYAVYWPLKHRTLSTQEYRRVIFVSWTLGALVCTIFQLQDVSLTSKQFALTLMSYFLVLSLIVCGCNIGIWRELQHRNIAFQQQSRAPQNQRLTKTLSFVAIFGLMSTLPLVVVHFLISFYDLSINWSLLQTVRLSCFSNGFLNPVVYALRIPEFRQALSLGCFKRQAAVNRGDHGSRNNRVADLVSKTELRAPRIDPCELQRACKREIFDTKL